MSKLLQAADIQPDELVLDVGAGLGYSSALAARMAEAVIALEEDADLAGEAERALSEASADNVAVTSGALVDGAPKHGPYDVVLIEGAVQDIPDALVDQLKEGGRIVAIFLEDALGHRARGLQGCTRRQLEVCLQRSGAGSAGIRETARVRAVGIGDARCWAGRESRDWQQSWQR